MQTAKYKRRLYTPWLGLTAELHIFVGAKLTVVDSVTAEVVTYTLMTAGTLLETARTLPRLSCTNVT